MHCTLGKLKALTHALPTIQVGAGAVIAGVTVSQLRNSKPSTSKMSATLQEISSQIQSAHTWSEINHWRLSQMASLCLELFSACVAGKGSQNLYHISLRLVELTRQIKWNWNKMEDYVHTFITKTGNGTYKAKKRQGFTHTAYTTERAPR